MCKGAGCMCVVIGCMGCGKVVKCSTGIQYKSLTRVYWFCGKECVEMRARYLTDYVNQLAIPSPPPHIQHILGTILSYSDRRQFYEVGSPASAVDTVSVDNEDVVVKVTISCERGDANV